ncbi:MAG: hypothetical protein JWM26_2678 [Betaproteobacteria bacterium]|jgi:hypothetical protein|nr:hypothetical protein [Betaproteobacteria bacterium]
MAELTGHTLLTAVRAVDAEMRRITDPVGGDVTELDPDLQELLLSYSKAATELKSYYLQVRSSSPGLPAYEEIVAGNRPPL